jgi:hypothetical protein
MLVITVLGVAWALMVDQPKLLALVLVIVLVIAFSAYAGLTTSRHDRSPREERRPGAQL